ncbi:MAG: metallophosphoesterase family protein [Erysipelotrichaceae bacterium]|nr:metallophosphoesterase family protein [Erysipelotrichaceae bacterium]
MIDLKTKKRIVLILVIAIVVTLFVHVNFLSAQQYTFRHQIIVNESIPKKFEGFRIALLSDIHLNSLQDVTRLEEIVEDLNAKNADMILFAGDLYEGKVFSKAEVTALLKSIDSSYGKFAVLGDEDLSHKKTVKSMLKEGGFEVLSNDTRSIYYNGKKIGLYGMTTDATKLKFSKSFKYSIVLAHYPDQFSFVQKKADLQLSGHSGGGYIYLPFYGSLVKSEHAEIYNHGTYKTETSTLMVTNGMSCTKAHHYKLMARNEILIITLHHSLATQ